MFKASRKLIFKLAVLVLMTAGIFIAGNKVSAWDCPICPEGMHCNHAIGQCECDCPDGVGGCIWVGCPWSLK
jgi:hypothetical protein